MCKGLYTDCFPQSNPHSFKLHSLKTTIETNREIVLSMTIHDCIKCVVHSNAYITSIEQTRWQLNLPQIDKHAYPSTKLTQLALPLNHFEKKLLFIELHPVHKNVKPKENNPVHPAGFEQATFLLLAWHAYQLSCRGMLTEEQKIISTVKMIILINQEK